MINDFSYVKSKLLISVIFDNVLYSWQVLVDNGLNKKYGGNEALYFSVIIHRWHKL